MKLNELLISLVAGGKISQQESNQISASVDVIKENQASKFEEQITKLKSEVSEKDTKITEYENTGKDAALLEEFKKAGGNEGQFEAFKEAGGNAENIEAKLKTFPTLKKQTGGADISNFGNEGDGDDDDETEGSLIA